MTEKTLITAIVCGCFCFAVGAAVIGNIYSPVVPSLTPAQLCAASREARGSAYCMEVAKAK